MKKTVTLFVIAIIAVLSNSTTASAQWTLGGGLYSAGEVGVGLSIYQNTDAIYKNTRGGGDIVYYFHGDYTLIEISANMHYFFLNKDNINAYAIVGTTYLGAFGDGAAAAVSGILNIGAGGEYGLSSGKIFAEARYWLLAGSQFGINAGFRINL